MPLTCVALVVQLHFTTSNASSWHLVNGEFDHVEFYNEIINYFKVMPRARAQACVDNLLQWWNL